MQRGQKAPLTYKAAIGPKLRARTFRNQQGEAAIAVEVLNHMIRTALYCNEEWHGDREELVTAALQNALATLASLTGRA